MSLDRFKDVEVNGTKYRVGRFPAKIGAWLADVTPEGALAQGIDTYNKVQDFLLSVCCIYVTPNVPGAVAEPRPIFSLDTGRFLIKDLDLEYDLDSLEILKTEVLKFNFTDFLRKRAARNKQLMEEMAAKKKAEESAEQASPSTT